MKSREPLKKEELIALQNNQNLENILSKIKIFKNDLKAEMVSYGMTEKIIQKVLNEQEVFNCPRCNTLNLYRIYSRTNTNLEFYKCDKCNEEYLD